jgi:hypothetical protein
MANARHAEPGRSHMLTIARLLQNGLGFLLSILVLHRFGMAGVGTLTIASVGVVVQATMLTFGMPYVLAKSPLVAGQRNAVGLCAALLALVLALPLCAGLGLVFGHSDDEALAIMLLALGGSYFAHTSIADALLVLESKTNRVVFGPLGSLGGMLWGAVFADSLAAFAGALAVGRLLGIMLLFSGISYRWCGLAAVGQHLRRGVRFLVPDTLGLLAEQMAVMLVTPFATRTELGQFGLCRQFLTVAETPLWSRLVAWYPRLCADPTVLHGLRWQMFLRGLLTAAVLMVVAPLLAWLVYRSPEVAWLAPLFLCCVPFRHISGPIEIGLRARDALASVNRLVLIRCALVLLVPIGLHLYRVQGIAMAMVLQMALLAWAAHRELRKVDAASRLTE